MQAAGGHLSGSARSLILWRMKSEYLTNNFLIAMPTMRDPNFDRTVTFICQHNEEGALGIVINRVVNLTVGEILDQMRIAHDEYRDSKSRVHYGGPVQSERGFILHQNLGAWDSTLPITSDIGLTTSRDILEALANNSGPDRYLLALGYAGWGSGQLEHEIKQNAWLSGPAESEIIFDTPIELRWSTAASRLGVDLNTLSPEAGHA